jgi:hypothetical protein
MIIMLGGPLVYCAVLFSTDVYLTGSSIYVYMSELVKNLSFTFFVHSYSYFIYSSFHASVVILRLSD